MHAAAAPVDLTKTTPAKTNNRYNLGPAGALGWMVVEGAMTVKSRQILITKVEEGSPADGKLEVGDVVLGVFGKPFTEDARKSFGWAIGRAETEEAKGILPLIVWRKGKTQTVDLKLQVMGTCSHTSPYDCPKAKKILGQGCALIAKDIKKQNRFPINELALMASGKPEYMDLVRKRAHALAASVPETEELWKASCRGGKLHGLRHASDPRRQRGAGTGAPSPCRNTRDGRCGCASMHGASNGAAGVTSRSTASS